MFQDPNCWGMVYFDRSEYDLTMLNSGPDISKLTLFHEIWPPPIKIDRTRSNWIMTLYEVETELSIIYFYIYTLIRLKWVYIWMTPKRICPKNQEFCLFEKQDYCCFAKKDLSWKSGLSPKFATHASPDFKRTSVFKRPAIFMPFPKELSF